MSKKVHKKIPVIREALADLDTPLSVYLKLANEPFTYLLESAQVGSEDGGKWDRYSIIGMRCPTRIRVVGTQIDVFNDDQIVESLSTSNPLSFIEEFQSRYQVADCDQDIRFIGGVGRLLWLRYRSICRTKTPIELSKRQLKHSGYFPDGQRRHYCL